MKVAKKKVSTNLNYDIRSKFSRDLLIDFTIEIVVTEIQLKVKLFLDPDFARIGPRFSVHFAAENAICANPGNHVRALLVKI